MYDAGCCLNLVSGMFHVHTCYSFSSSWCTNWEQIVKSAALWDKCLWQDKQLTHDYPDNSVEPVSFGLDGKYHSTILVQFIIHTTFLTGDCNIIPNLSLSPEVKHRFSFQCWSAKFELNCHYMHMGLYFTSIIYSTA